jgi:hypothetical protein
MTYLGHLKQFKLTFCLGRADFVGGGTGGNGAL